MISGVGCHPGERSAVAAYNRAAFAARAQTTALVGEVGLDAGSAVSAADQRRVFADVLEVVRAMPRLLSLHSVRAHKPLLDLLQTAKVPGAVLHWWTGSDAETSRANGFGCWFSVGPGMVGNLDRLARFPRGRVLTETDAPARGAVAGRVDDVEAVLAKVWKCDIEDVRRQIWLNFGALVDATGTEPLLPPAVQRLLAGVRAPI